MIFDALVTAIEAQRQVVIHARRNLTADRAHKVQDSGRAMLEMATADMAVTQQDRDDRATALYCQHQLEELLTALLPQIPD